jgi:hypothetical protein
MDTRPNAVHLAIDLGQMLSCCLHLFPDLVEKFMEMIRENSLQGQSNEPFPCGIGKGAYPLKALTRPTESVGNFPYSAFMFGLILGIPDLSELGFLLQNIGHTGHGAVISFSDWGIHATILFGYFKSIARVDHKRR